MILVNFKNFEETKGEGAIKYARVCREVAKETKVIIIPVIMTSDVEKIKQEVGIDVYLQEPGVRLEAGVAGTLINHGDHRLKPGTIRGILANWPKKTKSVLCLSTLGQMERWGKRLKPSYFGYEPKGLIGNRNKSVSSEYSKTIEKIVKMASPTPVLVGAGIHGAEDVKIALKMGAVGILVATDIIKAEDPGKELRELAKEFKPLLPRPCSGSSP